jgi:surface polysaccharide O-acyltransferase-like enzyme
MATDWKILQSKSIDALRFPMAVAVVMLHYSMFILDNAQGTLHWLCIFFQEGICRLAVPCFFFISGFLFFRGLQQWSWDEWKRKLRVRVRSLLIPYLLWNIIALLAYWGWSNLTGARISLFEEYQNLGGIRIFYNRTGALPIGPQASPLDDPLWFIRDLMYFILVTPAVYMFLKWTKAYGVIGMCLLFLFVSGSIPEGFVFFVLGAYLQYSGKNIVECLYPAKRWFVYLFIPLLIATCLLHGVSEYWTRFCKFFFMVDGIAASFCIAATVIEKNPNHPNTFLAESSFFIFALHNILVLRHIAAPVVYTVVSQETLSGSIVAFFLVPAFAILICLAFLFMMQKILPRTTGLLTGNRKKQTA